MPSLQQIANDWGVSRQYVSKCKQRGMPTDTFDHARQWRQVYATQRETTSHVQLEKQVALETDDDGPEARERRKAYFDNKPEGAVLPPVLSDLQGALDAAIRASDEAWRLLYEAMIERKDSKIGVRLSVHTKSVEARIKAETLVREELERRRILIPLSEAEDMSRQGWEIVISRLTALPQNCAPRCNPGDPHHAMEILQHECIGIMADAQKVFAPKEAA